MTDFATRRRMMVDTQVRPSDVTKFPIIDAMLRIPREAFVPDAEKEAAYAGRNVRLAENRVVLEPRTLAKMLDAVNIDNDDLVLDIGAGFGYSSAVIARIAEAVVPPGCAFVDCRAYCEKAVVEETDDGAGNTVTKKRKVLGGRLFRVRTTTSSLTYRKHQPGTLRAKEHIRAK